MRALTLPLAISAAALLSLSAVACGGDEPSSSGGGLSNGGDGGSGGSGGAGGTGGGGGAVVPPACTSANLGDPACVSCVGMAMATCPNLAMQCFSDGALFTCMETAGCLDQLPPDMGCVLSNCGQEMLAVNSCLAACPAYVACFR
ncbi:MAG TPA: hypothetical protein VN033_10835 [Vulgatibacter sp.]|nr:hypothetical protein [Vulgatibacter sp.]